MTRCAPCASLSRSGERHRSSRHNQIRAALRIVGQASVARVLIFLRSPAAGDPADPAMARFWEVALILAFRGPILDFPSAAAKLSPGGGRIRLMFGLSPVLLPHQPVDQPERQNSRG